MTEAARWNFQHGVPENKAYPWTDYTPEDDFDRWLVQRKTILDRAEQQLLQKQLEEQAAAELEKVLNKELEKLLKGFK